MRKNASEMFPLSELRIEYGQRIRSTAFMNSDPSYIVSFKIFSNVVPVFPVISEMYSQIIEKAINRISFYTPEGWHNISEVDYMFYDEENKVCVAVLEDGKDLSVCMPPISGNTHVLDVMPDHLIVSTKQLKKYFQDNYKKYPYLIELTRVMDSKISSREALTKKFRE